jgi:hypothetical protein
MFLWVQMRTQAPAHWGAHCNAQFTIIIHNDSSQITPAEKLRREIFQLPAVHQNDDADAHWSISRVSQSQLACDEVHASMPVAAYSACIISTFMSLRQDIKPHPVGA